MQRRIKENYPATKIVCATLLLCYRKDVEGKLNAESTVAEFDYNNVLRLAVEKENCILADLATSG